MYLLTFLFRYPEISALDNKKDRVKLKKINLILLFKRLH
jgi:hypothetical protein